MEVTMIKLLVYCVFYPIGIIRALLFFMFELLEGILIRLWRR